MEIKETYFFECLRCGNQARLIDVSPHCPRCHSRVGIVSDRQLPQPLADGPASTAAQAMTI